MKQEFDNFEVKLLRQTSLLIAILSFFALIFDLFRNQNFHLLFVWAILTVFGVGLFFLFKQKKYFKVGRIAISVLTIVLTNFSWIYNQGSIGPTYALFIMWLVFMVFVWERKIALFCVAFLFINVSVLFFLEYHYPDLFPVYLSREERIIDVGIGLFFALLLALFYASFVKQAYNQKIKKAQESEELKTAFLQNISHEIRSPMNSIMGFSNLLKKQNLSAINKNKYIETINSSGQQLIGIIDDIVKISMLETNQVEVSVDTVDIKKLMRELYELANVSPYLSRNVIIREPSIQIYSNHVIKTDGVKLNQILQNLLTNALKFTDMGAIELGCVEKNNMFEFYVKDSGIGIDKSNIPLIFERFRQVERTSHSKYKGSGLGLAISKSYIEMLEGKIWVDSQKGKGSTFYFTIPLEEASENEISLKTEFKTIKQKTILVAEDDELNYNFIKILLEKRYNLLRARNGQEAVDIVNSGGEIDCILMDIKMPVLNGVEAAKMIKKFHPDLKIIAQTAYKEIEDKEYFSKTSFDDYILKPINPESLNELLSYIMAS